MERPVVRMVLGGSFSMVVLISCRGSAPAPPSPGPLVSSSASGLSSALAVVSAVRHTDGCWGVALSQHPDERLAQLGQRCAEGLNALFSKPIRVELAPEETKIIPLPTAKAGTCLRASAVTAQGTTELTLLETDGRALGSDADAAFSMVPLTGVTCTAQGGSLAVRLRSVAQAEHPAVHQVWVQAWGSAQ